MNRPAKLIGVAGFPQSQRGLSKWGWLIVLVLGAGLMTTVLRLGPHYIDYRIVGGVVERLDASQVHNMSFARTIALKRRLSTILARANIL